MSCGNCRKKQPISPQLGRDVSEITGISCTVLGKIVSYIRKKLNIFLFHNNS